MNPLAISAFFTSAVSLVLGGLVFVKKRKDHITISYTLITLSFFIWIFGIGMEIEAPNKDSGLFWNTWLYSGAIFIPAFFIHFVQAYLDKINVTRLVLSYLVSCLFLFFNFTSLFVKDVVPKGSFNYASVPGILFPFFVLYFCLIIIYASYLMIKEFKQATGTKRNQLKFIILASVIGFSGGSTNFLLVFDIFRIPPIGNYFIAFYLVVLFYAIVKHHLMDINIVLKKGTTYALLLVLLFVPSFLLILFLQKIFFHKMDYLFSTILLFLLFFVTLFFHKIKPGTERTVEQFLFKNRYDYRETLGTFSKVMVSILDLRSLSKRMIETVTQTMGVEKASLFLLNEEKGGYELYESKNIRINSPPSHLSKGDPLPHYLQKIGEITIRERLMKGSHLPELAPVIMQMASLEAEASIPLTSKGHLVGLLNLSHKFDKDIYSQEDIDLLSTLANQTAIAIENAKLYEDLKRSKSYIRRSDRLASLGTLTAGLAHEIRNPLTAVKTLTQLLPDRLGDEEFRNEFLRIASGEVDRISSLINELLEFARPSDPRFQLEEINPILDGMILLTSTESKQKKIEIVKDYLQDVPPISVDREQIKQVFLNILLNAIEATPPNGRIIVKTRSFVKPGGKPYLQVEITDNGTGIPREFMEDIFNPFFTTKSKGSGLGLSISSQIVQDHDGYIHVESEVNRGSSFFINLPLTQDLDRLGRKEDDNESLRHP
jgi:signal transduction histidine kinase